MTSPTTTRPATDHPVIIRDATEADLPAITAIYNDAVANTTAIWNEVQVDLANRTEWFGQRQARGFPVLVAESGGEVAGYASFGDWRALDRKSKRLNSSHQCASRLHSSA